MKHVDTKIKVYSSITQERDICDLNMTPIHYIIVILLYPN